MTPQNIMDYVKVYENHIPADLCKSTTERLNTIEWNRHSFYHPRKDSFESGPYELAVSHEEIPEKAEINQKVWFAIERYVLKDFASFDEWFDGWNGFMHVRFNRYDPTTRMKKHCDHIHSLFDGERKGVPILTIVGALNDGYEGGEFIMFDDHRIHLPAGAVLVFPSNFMYPHEVKPVKSGVRYSFVSWTW